MKVIDIKLPDLSDHPPKSRVDIGVFESWVRGNTATRTRSEMTEDEIHDDFAQNKGRMGEFRYDD